ncbi:2OG-Fe(II) oxygenase superfamily protein [Aureococcus anophagefferens]|uniref:2OG-Fe(II) oxygenase superfamily protein n=1 Tax=Aureococcus anophagefferens TaxID=44056 RepID=A0ABR1G2W6_AURAN
MEGAPEAATEPEPDEPEPEASMLPPWLERTFLRGLAAAWGCALEAETLRVVKWENRTVELAATKVVATCGDAGVVCSAAGLATAVAVSDRFSRDDGYGVFKAAGRLAVASTSWGVATEDVSCDGGVEIMALSDDVWPRWKLEVAAPSIRAGRGDEKRDVGLTARASWLKAPGWALAKARGHAGRLPGDDMSESTARRPETPAGWIHPNAGAQPIAPGGLVVDLDDCGVGARRAARAKSPRQGAASVGGAPVAAARGLVLETQTLAGGAVARSRAAADGVDVECDDAAPGRRARGRGGAAAYAPRRSGARRRSRRGRTRRRSAAVARTCSGAGLSAEVKAVDGKVDASLVGLFAAATAASASAAVGAPPGGPPPEGPTTLATLSGGEATRHRTSPALPWDDDARARRRLAPLRRRARAFARPAAASVRGA